MGVYEVLNPSQCMCGSEAEHHTAVNRTDSKTYLATLKKAHLALYVYLLSARYSSNIFGALHCRQTATETADLRCNTVSSRNTDVVQLSECSAKGKDCQSAMSSTKSVQNITDI